jgi:hypothetical protein
LVGEMGSGGAADGGLESVAVCAQAAHGGLWVRPANGLGFRERLG